jgi:hypothetical protein
MNVTDVYQGTHMENIERGDVKWLRVIESTEKRFWTLPLWDCGQFVKKHQGKIVTGYTLNRPSISWAGFETKRILGTVPVEADGSAHFELPAEAFVYFQLLDHDSMMISTMRSGTLVQPGESQSCVGCHENRLSTPPPQKLTTALKRAPSKLDGWYGPARTFNYMTQVSGQFHD